MVSLSMFKHKAVGGLYKQSIAFSKNDDKVNVSAEVKNTCPVSANGKLRFVPTRDGYYLQQLNIFLKD